MSKTQKGIYLPKDILKRAKLKCAIKDINFSSYIENLIKKDLEAKNVQNR